MPGEQASQACLEIDLRLPTEQLSCERRVRDEARHVAGSVGEVLWLEVGASDEPGHERGQNSNGRFRAAAEVDRGPDGTVRVRGERDTACGVIDIGEVACLGAVAEDQWRETVP